LIYGFFPGCAYQAAAGYKESVDAVCGLLGIELREIEDWNCCGATAAFSRSQKEALVLTGRLFALAARQGFEEIVTVCNACYSTLKKAAKLLDGQPALLEQVNRVMAAEGLLLEHPLPVKHLLEVMLRDRSRLSWPRGECRLPEQVKVAAYYGCQLTRPWQDVPRALRPDILESLLEAAGIEAVDHSARTLCCGASHAVAYSGRCQVLIDRIINGIRAKGGNLVTTVCPLCQFNLDQGQQGRAGDKVPVTYFTQVLGLAFGLPPEKLGLKKLLVPLKRIGL